jgi:hypothetical protein
MLTLEAGGTRLETGLATIAAELASWPRAEVEVRTLGDPWQRQDALSSEAIAALVRDAGQREPIAPPAGLLRPDRQHWLLTDGADAEVLEAGADIGFSRVFRVGETTRNAGIVRLSARRSLGDRDQLDLELQVSNGGDVVEERVVILSTESGEVTRASITLEPGTSATVSAETPMASAVQARLEPGDALADDDTIALDASPLFARRVSADPACPVGIVAALRAHPALSVTGDSAAADLVVECGGGAVGIGSTGGTAGMAKIPRIRFLRERPPVRVDGPLLWASSVTVTQRRSVESLALRTRGLLAPPGSGETLLLAAGSMPLIVERRRAGPPLIETALDAEADDASTVAPLLVALLVDRAVSASLLDAVAVTARTARAVAVVPREAALSTATDSAGLALQSRHWMGPLIVAAALVLLWELATLLRRWRRERIEAEAWPG